MRTRHDLHEALLDILVECGVMQREDKGHLYFQPPESVKIVYPAIVYSLATIRAQHADNLPYAHRRRFTITAIDKNPDSRIPYEIAKLPSVGMDRFFTSENLNHWTFSISF